MWVQLNQELVPAERARISVFDRGFMYGDGIFETMRAYNGRPFRLDSHLDRLAASAAALKLPLPRSPAEIESDIRTVLERNERTDAAVRISVSRGVGGRGPAIPADASPTYVVAAHPLPEDLEVRRQNGLRLALAGVRKTSPDALPAGAKVSNYLNSILAHAEAAAAGADEALMRSADGSLAECSTANLFIVLKGRLVTPEKSTGILPGITREIVLGIAERTGIEVEETLLMPEALADAEEVFLTNSVIELVPVRSVDSRDFPVPGPVTARLMERYHEMVRNETHG